MISVENFIKARADSGMSESELARKVGVSQSLIDQIERGQVRTSKFIFAFAKAMDVHVSVLDPLLGPETTGQPPRLAVNGSRQPDLPVYSTAEGGRGSMILAWEPIEYLHRIDPLLTVLAAYGMRVVGESMEPAYFQGDTVFVNPNLPPRPGSDVLLFQSRIDNETKAMIKRLVKITPDEWHLEQYNPPQKFKLPRKEWQNCQMIVGKYNR